MWKSSGNQVVLCTPEREASRDAPPRPFHAPLDEGPPHPHGAAAHPQACRLEPLPPSTQPTPRGGGGGGRILAGAMRVLPLGGPDGGGGGEGAIEWMAWSASGERLAVGRAGGGASVYLTECDGMRATYRQYCETSV
jgi:hypothetical protein